MTSVAYNLTSQWIIYTGNIDVVFSCFPKSTFLYLFNLTILIQNYNTYNEQVQTLAWAYFKICRCKENKLIVIIIDWLMQNQITKGWG
jgi:hypothetical protein